VVLTEVCSGIDTATVMKKKGGGLLYASAGVLHLHHQSFLLHAIGHGPFMLLNEDLCLCTKYWLKSPSTHARQVCLSLESRCLQSIFIKLFTYLYVFSNLPILILG
jgi:hypothetical protein